MVRNILDYLESSEKLVPDQIAFADEKVSCTYRELKQTAKAIGTYLADRCLREVRFLYLWKRGYRQSVHLWGRCMRDAFM